MASPQSWHWFNSVPTHFTSPTVMLPVITTGWRISLTPMVSGDHHCEALPVCTPFNSDMNLQALMSQSVFISANYMLNIGKKNTQCSDYLLLHISLNSLCLPLNSTIKLFVSSVTRTRCVAVEIQYKTLTCTKPRS